MHIPNPLLITTLTTLTTLTTASAFPPLVPRETHENTLPSPSISIFTFTDAACTTSTGGPTILTYNAPLKGWVQSFRLTRSLLPGEQLDISTSRVGETRVGMTCEIYVGSAVQAVGMDGIIVPKLLGGEAPATGGACYSLKAENGPSGCLLLWHH